MSECVVRMEMPKSCVNCDLRYECNALFYDPGNYKPLMRGCRIVCSLPEGHGRLVDADAYDYPGDLKWEPTIVPAERSET